VRAGSWRPLVLHLFQTCEIISAFPEPRLSLRRALGDFPNLGGDFLGGTAVFYVPRVPQTPSRRSRPFLASPLSLSDSRFKFFSWFAASVQSIDEVSFSVQKSLPTICLMMVKPGTPPLSSLCSMKGNVSVHVSRASAYHPPVYFFT